MEIKDIEDLGWEFEKTEMRGYIENSFRFRFLQIKDNMEYTLSVYYDNDSSDYLIIMMNITLAIRGKSAFMKDGRVKNIKQLKEMLKINKLWN